MWLLMGKREKKGRERGGETSSWSSFLVDIILVKERKIFLSFFGVEGPPARR